MLRAGAAREDMHRRVVLPPDLAAVFVELEGERHLGAASQALRWLRFLGERGIAAQLLAVVHRLIVHVGIEQIELDLLHVEVLRHEFAEVAARPVSDAPPCLDPPGLEARRSAFRMGSFRFAQALRRHEAPAQLLRLRLLRRARVEPIVMARKELEQTGLMGPDGHGQLLESVLQGEDQLVAVRVLGTTHALGQKRGAADACGGPVRVRLGDRLVLGQIRRANQRNDGQGELVAIHGAPAYGRLRGEAFSRFRRGVETPRSDAG